LLIRAGEPFVQAQLNRGVANVAATYRSRGYTRPQVQPNIVELGEGVTPEGRVRVRIDIIEGPRTFVADVAFAGNEALTAAQLATLIRTAPGRPYSETDLVADRDAIDLEYRNRGYENVVVTPSASLVDGGGAANVLFTISEGPQVIVDHVI